MRFGNFAYHEIDGRERPALPLITPRCLPVTLGATRHTGNYLRVSIWPLGPIFDKAPTSKIFKKSEGAAQIRSAKIIDKQVHDIIGSDVTWGKNRLVVKYTLSRLKSDIKSRVIRLSASPPVNTPTMGARGGNGGGGLCPSVRTPD